MGEVTREMVEAAARATCALDRADPDEIMPDGLPRWRDREEHSRVAIQAALTTAQAEIERLTKALEATRDHCPQCEGEGQYLFGPRRNQNKVPCEFCENARAALSGSQT